MKTFSGLDRRVAAMEATAPPPRPPPMTPEELEAVEERLAALPPEILQEISWLLDKIERMCESDDPPEGLPGVVDRLTLAEIGVMEILISRIQGVPSMEEEYGDGLKPVVRKPISEPLRWEEGRRSIIDLDGREEGGGGQTVKAISLVA